MDIGRIFEKTRAWSKITFTIPLALILFVFAFFFAPFQTEGYVEGEGTVKKVVEVENDDHDDGVYITYETTFVYTVDGVDYEQSYSLNEQKQIGDKLTFYYDPENPNRTASSLNNAWLWIVFVALGAGAVVLTVYFIIKDAKRLKQTAALRERQKSVANYRPTEIDKSSLTEYYFRFDGRAFLPGYLIEDKERKPVFVGRMKNNFIVVPRKFIFTDMRTQKSVEHSVSHVVTGGVENYGMFSISSYFKLDGVNIWDSLHQKGVLINNGMGDGFAQMAYDVTLNGNFLARAEMTSIYVHEEDEEGKILKPYNKMFYRIWTDSDDLELVFTTVFAIAETEQIVYS